MHRHSFSTLPVRHYTLGHLRLLYSILKDLGAPFAHELLVFEPYSAKPNTTPDIPGAKT